MLKPLAGGVMLLFGVVLYGWIGYNLLIERQPESKNLSPVPALIFGLLLLTVGFRWVKGAEPAPVRKPKKLKKPRDTDDDE